MVYAVIFDMDGVLIESSGIIINSFQKCFTEYGLNISKDEIAEYFGQPLRKHIDVVEAKHNLNIDYDQFVKDAFAIQSELMKKVKADPNLVKFLEELKANNIPIAVGTSSRGFRAEKFLEIVGLKKYFDVIVASEDVKNHKPAPDVFLEAAKRLGKDPKNCVVFEDAPVGITAAKTGGMKAVGKYTPFVERKDLSHADKIIDSFSEVSFDVLKELF